MMNSAHKKLLGAILILGAVIGLSVLAYTRSKSETQVISSFTECVAAGYPIMETYPPQCRTPNGKNFIGPLTQEVGGLKTVTDTETGITFTYPATLDTKYITTVDWPPKIQVTPGPFTCMQAGSETTRAGKTEARTINYRTYCVTTEAGAAAGSTYLQYAYAFAKGSNVVILTFTLKEVQCLNYDDPQKAECMAERKSFDLDMVISEIAESF